MREVEEWIGKTDDTPVPDRVQLRLWERYHGTCGCCWRPIMARDVQFDHIIAICNGGQNRESNIRPVHSWCHTDKTKGDLAQKARDYRKRRKHVLGRKQTKRSFATNRAGPFKRKIDGTIERRR